MFFIKQQAEGYVVVPTPEYLLQNFNRFEFPYDSNWEIYKLYNFLPKQLFHYLTVTFNATVCIYEEYPYATISFKNETDAKNFLKDLERRAQDLAEKNI